MEDRKIMSLTEYDEDWQEEYERKEKRNLIIKKVQNLIENGELSITEVELSEEEHFIFNEMIENNSNTQLDGNYIKDTYRRGYDDESYYYDATPEEQAEMDKTDGNDYLSIRIGEKLFLNEDFDRCRRTSSIKLANMRLHGDGDYEYGEENFDIANIITPEKLIEGMQDISKDLSSLSIEKLQEIISENNEQIASNDEVIKQALIQKILIQQQTIAKQQKEISRLKSQKELE